MEIIADFFVAGDPKPAGSKRAFVLRRKGGAIITRANGAPAVVVTDMSGQAGKDWRGDVKAAALAAHTHEPIDGPLVVEMLFVMQRPKAHFRTNGALRPDAPTWHTKKPDATKLLRSVEDALTGIVWGDDNAVMPRVEKVYGARPGVRVRVTRATVPALFSAEQGATIGPGLLAEAAEADTELLARYRLAVACRMAAKGATT